MQQSLQLHLGPLFVNRSVERIETCHHASPPYWILYVSEIVARESMSLRSIDETLLLDYTDMRFNLLCYHETRS